MSKLTTFIFLIFFTCTTNLSFSIENKTQDSISNYLKTQFYKYQETDIDSCNYFAQKLINHYYENLNDSLAITTQQNLGFAYQLHFKLDSSLKQYEDALQLASAANNHYLIVRSHLFIGNNYNNRSQLFKAEKQYKIALNLSKNNNLKRYEAISYIELGHIYSDLGNYSKALDVYLKANKLVETFNINDLKFSALINIANTYSNKKQWDLSILKLNNLLKSTKINQSQTAIIYTNLGTAYEEKKEYQKALDYHLKAFKIDEKAQIQGSTNLGQDYHNLGSVYYYLKNYTLAIEYLEKSLDFAKKTKSRIDYIYNYEILAKVYTKLKQFDKANTYLSDAMSLAKEVKMKDKELNLTKFKTEYYFATGNLGLAEKTFFEYDSLRNLYIKNEKSETFIQMQTLYETDKKEKENELLKAQNKLTQNNLKEEIRRKNQFIISFGISIVILIVIIFLLRKMSKAHKVIKNFNNKLEESNEKLKLINNTKDKFSSIIAHDLRSPLGAILSFSNLIDDECNSSKEIETVAEYNTYLNQSARNLNSLLDNLLQWSKSQLGNIKHYATNFNLSMVIEDNIEIQKLKAKEKSIDIRSQVEENTHVYADINMVNTIIRNLLNNAIKFSYPKSEITLFAKTDGNMLHLSVQDKGIGLSQDKQEKLFKIGNNLSTPGTNNEIGTGLGLILCKEFAETNGGKIWITSEESKGSTFTFTIPLKKA
ncbi:tetratricopeptide repeat-containing sensor histidine kinase [Ancylomarina sp. 16SWW S1-10-2]|uniref:tetratricopeptide repeat-containing sensor histidine kinase n=1 Tax=Ancylomarina sp. 16SWW S1-10-2 TaxID=2499681 RepID=UPI0012AE7D92|nr:tetratricopeptide repeat-containing sensor histidine kinase [Ancylomarina sp. 16SWW S1-10-2]MRT94395.1 tetratricopeptide repeat protein [Ancylomarina sp. 16SWW S1-10-2]